MDTTTEEFLAYYGVKGMKLGIRNDVGAILAVSGAAPIAILGGGIGTQLLTYNAMSKKLVPKGEKRTKERYVSKVIKM